MKCPVCDNVNTSMLCPNCGFDSSRDYGRYPTFGPVKQLDSASELRKERQKITTVVEQPKDPAVVQKRRKPLVPLLATVFALILVLGILAGAGSGEEKPEPVESGPARSEAASTEPRPTDQSVVDDNRFAEPVEISLWTYPIGNWSNESAVRLLIADFNAVYPNITVKVEYLDYTRGDDKVNDAIADNRAPDIIMEGPERLVAGWGSEGLLVDLSDIVLAGTYEPVVAACTSASGEIYELPVCMLTYCMAINRDVFEDAGALQYLNEQTHTWNSVEDFFKAVQAVYDAGYRNVGTIYCGGQGGDQGTRALITNLRGGTYTNAEHTAFSFASRENAQALSELYAQDGIVFNSDIVGGDEIKLFVDGTLPMAFCWNIAQERNYADVLSFDVLPMAFPSDSKASLEGGIFGFGVFDNGDDARIEAAKTFIEFMTVSDAQYFKSVAASTYEPCRNLPNAADLNPLFPEYAVFGPMMGDYYKVIDNWSLARGEWWQMLQRVMKTDGSVDEILAEMQIAQEAANVG